MIKFQHSGKCLLVKDKSTSEAAQVIQETCPDSSPNDRSFKFIE